MNEDVHIVRADQGLFVVCDGMGGAAAGEVASRIAAETIVSHLNDFHVPEGNHDEPGLLPHTSRLLNAVRRSNELVHHQALYNPQQADMGTTAVTVLIDQQIASVAHVGDSRAYLQYDGQIVRLTCDHSLAGSENILLRALGRQPDVDVTVAEVPLQPDDYLLLCTDGLTRMVPDTGLAEAVTRLRNPQLICDELVETANQRGGTDNITVVVVQVMGNWWQRRASSWRRNAGGATDVTVHRQM